MFNKLKTQWYFLKYNLVKSTAKKYFTEVMHNQQLSANELDALNWQKTKDLLSYAYKHVPYYRRRFDEIKLKPEDIKQSDDFIKVPVLTRQDLMNNFEQLISDEASRKDLRLSTTGGSSGKPAKVYHQKNIVRAAMGWRMLSWWGLAADCNWASIYRDTRTTIKFKIIDLLCCWPQRKIVLNATSFDDNDIKRFIKKINKYKPQLLHGYVGAMEEVATFILDNKITVHAPTAIWTTSAPITAIQQKRIEQAFHAPVYDQYGCCEIYWLAAECPSRNGLHIFHDVRRIEFLDDNNQPLPVGQLGNIAVTDLENRYFPLIRYLNGDKGRALEKQCDCGCNLPMMDKVKGRVSETFILPSGKRLNGEYLTTLFDDFPDAVKQFRVHQNKDYSIVIMVVPNSGCSEFDKILEIVVSRLNNQINSEVSVTIEQVENIPQTGGKLRFITTDIK
jgi:phenylacetate-coenzyme A ligase PaaK-like adenylate-forming protein